MPKSKATTGRARVEDGTLIYVGDLRLADCWCDGQDGFADDEDEYAVYSANAEKLARAWNAGEKKCRKH